MDTSTIIAIIIFVVLSAIVIGLIFLLSKKKKPANQFTLMPITPINKDIKVEPLEEKKEEKVPQVEEVKEEIKEVEEVKEQEIVKEEKKEEPQPSLINIPINNMDDTPIVIEEAKAIVENNTDEMITIGDSKPLNENVNNEEAVKVEENIIIEPQVDNNPIIEPQVEEVKTEYVQTEPVVTQTELIQSEEPKEVIMTNDAFSQTPDDNHDINTDFKVEDKHEYMGNKTEILDVEEIKRTMASKE